MLLKFFSGQDLVKKIRAAPLEVMEKFEDVMEIEIGLRVYRLPVFLARNLGKQRIFNTSGFFFQIHLHL